jgi:hypothetical protein
MLFRHISKYLGLFTSKVIVFSQIGFFICSFAQAHPLEQIEGLKRFNKTSKLVDPRNPNLLLTSTLDIKNVKLGQNVLAKSIDLSEQGGEIHNITAGNRSDKVTFSFFQPFQESTLEQRIELNFDKNSGFIDALNLRYFIGSAYLSIELIREQVLQSAVAKYGNPLTLQEVQTATGQANGQVKIADFIESKANLSDETRRYFKKMGVTRNAKITADKQGYALFQNGFDQCYLWPQSNFIEILSLCAFAPGAANASNRGLEFSLINFTIATVISEHKIDAAKQLKLSL